jgi:mRNA-degrading endonuclease RelE of RelBE toxin-antitoxin system
MKPVVEVRALRRFRRDLKLLFKKYHRIREDVDAFVERLRNGEMPGDQIPRVGYTVFKARIASSDSQKGKRGGYRIIYYVRTASRVFLVTIYAKAYRSDVTPEEIRRIIDEEGDLDTR